MTFEDILDQALAMLQRRGRVTLARCGAQFALDAAARNRGPRKTRSSMPTRRSWMIRAVACAGRGTLGQLLFCLLSCPMRAASALRKTRNSSAVEKAV